MLFFFGLAQRFFRLKTVPTSVKNLESATKKMECEYYCTWFRVLFAIHLLQLLGFRSLRLTLMAWTEYSLGRLREVDVRPIRSAHAQKPAFYVSLRQWPIDPRPLRNRRASLGLLRGVDRKYKHFSLPLESSFEIISLWVKWSGQIGGAAGASHPLRPLLRMTRLRVLPYVFRDKTCHKCSLNPYSMYGTLWS